jgi:hypothetical protein
MLSCNLVQLFLHPKGCYSLSITFIMNLCVVLCAATVCRYINNEVLSRFRGFGGVRLEDVVVVREVRIIALCDGFLECARRWCYQTASLRSHCACVCF